MECQGYRTLEYDSASESLAKKVWALTSYGTSVREEAIPRRCLLLLLLPLPIGVDPSRPAIRWARRRAAASLSLS